MGGLALILVVSLGADPRVSSQMAESVDAKAKALIADAKTLFSRVRYLEAIAKFREAHAVMPNSTNVYNIGKCHERLDEPGLALRNYREYLRLEPAAREDAVLLRDISYAEKRLQAKGLQQLVVYVEPAAAQVAVDGQALANWPAYVELGAGEHELVVWADGYEAARSTFEIDLTHISERTVKLRSATRDGHGEEHASKEAESHYAETPVEPQATMPAQAAPPGESPESRDQSGSSVVEAVTSATAKPTPVRRTWAYTMVGVAGSCAVAGVVFGVLTLQFAADARGTPAPATTLYEAHVSTAIFTAVTADVLYGVSLISAAVGAWLFVSSMQAERGHASRSTGSLMLAGGITTGGGGVILSGGF